MADGRRGKEEKGGRRKVEGRGRWREGRGVSALLQQSSSLGAGEDDISKMKNQR